jgi:molecular chaperone Hsp33
VISSSDTVLRALTDDGSFRVIAVDTTETVRGAVAAQRVNARLSNLLGEVITGSVLVRESMAPDYRLQAILQGSDRRTRIVADTHPSGSTRGLVQVAEGVEDMPMGEGALLQVARTLHNGTLQQGVVQVPTDKQSVSSAFMAYMADSEQTVTMMAVACHHAGGQVVAAGGYLVQVLPEAQQGPLMVMTERLKDFEDILPLLARGAATPATLLDETLYGMPYTRVAERSVHFGCNCSPERLSISLASLPRADIESLLEGGQVLDIECDYCRTAYAFSPAQLRSLLENN